MPSSVDKILHYLLDQRGHNYARIRKKILLVKKHIITCVFKISNIGYKEQKLCFNELFW